MPNFEKNLAEESKKIQKLRDKLRQQLDLVEQRVIERALKNKIIKMETVKKDGSPSKILSKTLYPNHLKSWPKDGFKAPKINDRK